MEAHNVPPAHEQGKRSLQDSQQHDIKHDNYYKIDSSRAYMCPRIITTIRGHIAQHYIISSSGRQTRSSTDKMQMAQRGSLKMMAPTRRIVETQLQKLRSEVVILLLWRNLHKVLARRRIVIVARGPNRLYIYMKEGARG